MTKLGAAALGFAVGALAMGMSICKDVDNGDVVHIAEDYYVKAAKSKSHGWSFARVTYTKPE